MDRDEWLHIHMMGKCREQRCQLIFKEEMDLGLPHDPVKREAWYHSQSPEWQEWRRNIYLHRWSFQVGTCNHCEAKGIGVKSGRKMLCVDWCLNTNLHMYPTGHLQPCLSDLIDHAKRCTSHLSSLTSKHIAHLGTLYGSSSHTAGMERYGHTFSSKKDVTRKNYSSPMPSPNLGLLVPIQPNSPTPKR